MFKKLKDKIAEEVKSSPQRIQQLTQSVTERIQNATSDESFFSIGDDDAPSSSPNPEPGFSNVSLSSYSTPGRNRRNSNSSVASDMSFLPRYESATNLYHLQSDLDISASEVEDNASTSSSQLGHLSKEQIYAAFQKAQVRYHKYRGRYTDIANHYKELERENGKMKSVLVETQDKALRRVAELREQCSLEQKAKAHLENALRVELDEKQYVIDTLKTKVNLLQAGIKNSDQMKVPEQLLVNVNDNSFSINDDTPMSDDNNLDILTKDLKDARIEIENLNGKIQEMKANAIVFGSKEADFKKKILDLEELIKQKTQENLQVLERERENNLIIAQTKMELHTEIQNRDLEIENLKQDVETLKSDLDQYENKPKIIIGKMENLQSQNTKLIEKVEELTQKCNNYESELLKTEQLRIEIQNLNKIIETFKVKIQELEKQEKEIIDEKLEEFEAIKQKKEALDVELRDLKQNIEQTNEENIRMQEQLKAQKSEYETKIEAYREDTKQNLLTLETKIKEKIKLEYEEKQEKLSLDFQEKLEKLSKTDNNVKETQLKLMEKEEQAKNLQENLKSVENNLEKQLEKYKNLETNHLELISECAEVRNKLNILEKEHSELEKTLTSTEKQFSELQNKFSEQQSEICALKETNSSLQRKTNEHQETIESLTNENQRLLTENAGLKIENSNTNDYENLQSKNICLQEEIVELQNKLTSLQNEIFELKNSNAEIINKNTDLENENLKLLHDNSDLCEEKTKLQSEIAENESRLKTIEKEIDEKQNKILLLEEKTSEHQKTIAELTDAKQKLETMEITKEKLNKKIKEQKTKFHEEIQNLNKEILSFKEKNKIIQISIDEYKQKLVEYENGASEKSLRLEELTATNITLNEELNKFKAVIESSKEENINLTKNLESIKQELSQKIEEIQNINVEKSDLNLKLQNATDENNNLKKQISQIQTDSSKTTTEIISSNEKLQEQLKTISEENAKLKKEISQLQEVETQQLSDLHGIEDDYKILQTDKDELVSAVEELQAKMHELSNENRWLHEEISRLQKQEEDVFKEKQETKENHNKILEEISELKRRNNELSLDYNQVTQENEGLLQELAEVKLKYETLDLEKTKWENSESEKNQILNELEMYKTEIEKSKTKEEPSQDTTEKLENENKSLKIQLSRLEEHCETCEKQKKNLEGQLRELEHQYSEITHEKQLLQDEVQELKISPINMNNHITNTTSTTTINNAEKLDNLDIIHTDTIYGLEKPSDVKQLQETHEKEINNLNEKLIQYKSLDLTNRSSIQFYENELQKLKNKNEKLNRKLDETLVTLNHCTELSTSTETEYLRNVLYNYMLGKEGIVLARVIAAVCKFDENQTEAILQREQQKQTLLGQLGFR